MTAVKDREGVARLTRVAKPTDDSGLMPPVRPAGRRETAKSKADLLPTTGVARLTPKAPVVARKPLSIERLTVTSNGPWVRTPVTVPPERVSVVDAPGPVIEVSCPAPS